MNFDFSDDQKLLQHTVRDYLADNSPLSVCREILETDFSRVSWQLDDPEDREKLVLWAGLGGSFLADFAADPALPRVFAWILSPCPVAAQFSLQAHKGRDGRSVPTSVVVSPERFRGWLDDPSKRVTRAQLQKLVALGPVGLRAAVSEEALPGFFVCRTSGRPVAQAVVPGGAPHWSALLQLLHARTGHGFLGATSANFSRHGGHPRAGGAHHELSSIQRDMGSLGIPIVAGPVSCAGVPLPPPLRGAGYGLLSAPFRGQSEAQLAATRSLLPSSLSLLGPREEPGVWDLLRHGSLHEEVLASALSEVGVRLVQGRGARLRPSSYGWPPSFESGRSQP